MSGLIGHINYPWELYNLTFNDIRTIIVDVVSGNIKNATEKIDGHNLYISVINGEVCSARNKNDVFNNGMNENNLNLKFKDYNENVKDTFIYGFNVIKNFIDNNLSNSVKDNLFKNGNIWYPVEITYKKNPNVIHYDNNNIIFHSHGIFDKANAKFIYNDILNNYLKNSLELQKFNISHSKHITLKNMGINSLNKFLSKLDNFMNENGLNYYNSLEEYIMLSVAKNLVLYGVSMPENIRHGLIGKIIGKKDSLPLNFYKKRLSKDSKNKLKLFLKNSKNIIENIIWPIESLMNEISIKFLKEIDSMFIVEPKSEIERIKEYTNNLVNMIKNVEDKKVIKFIKKLDIDNISSVEGIVFLFKDNIIKLNGNFSSINFLKNFVDKNKISFVEEKNYLRECVKHILNNNIKLLD